MPGLHRALLPVAVAAALVATACLDTGDPFDRLSDSEYLAPLDSVPPDSTYTPPDTTASDSTVLPPDTTTAPLGVLRLLEPEPWAWIPQNDSTLSCPAHEHRGSGFSIHFRWAAPDSAPTPAAYRLYAKKETALYPIIDIWLGDTEYRYVSCNAFVIDRNLSGWYWTVEALDSTATVMAQSEVRWFGFQPCRLGNGQPCSAPGAPATVAGPDRPRTGVEGPLRP